MRRTIPLALLLSTLAGPAGAELPALGDPTSQTLTDDEEYALGEAFMRQLRSRAQIIEDPLLREYLQAIGTRIASAAPPRPFPFRFFLVADDTINAFAAPGGFIAVHSGLFLATRSEDELAAVIAHEVAHVTQRHIARRLEAGRQTSLITLASLLAAMALSGSSGEATEASLYAGMAASAQRQLNYTRQHEHEADRIGIDILAGAGFDPRAMADFFQTMQERDRYASDTQIELLRTHPVNPTRIAEARQRAERLPHPPAERSLDYDLAHARLAVLFGDAPAPPAAEGASPLANSYAHALRQMEEGRPKAALDALADTDDQRANPWFALLEARALTHLDRGTEARRTLEASLALYPDNQALTLQLAELELDHAPLAAIERLEPIVTRPGAPAESYRLLSRAAAAAGRPALEHEALASHFLARGRPHEALDELERAARHCPAASVCHDRVEAMRTRIEETVRQARN